MNLTFFKEAVIRIITQNMVGGMESIPPVRSRVNGKSKPLNILKKPKFFEKYFYDGPGKKYIGGGQKITTICLGISMD